MIDIRYENGRWTVLADEVDITSAISGLSLLATKVGYVPEVTLNIVGVSGLTASEMRKAKIPARSRAALIALGWTPPPDVKS